MFLDHLRLFCPSVSPLRVFLLRFQRASIYSTAQHTPSAVSCIATTHLVLYCTLQHIFPIHLPSTQLFTPILPRHSRLPFTRPHVIDQRSRDIQRRRRTTRQNSTLGCTRARASGWEARRHMSAGGGGGKGVLHAGRRMFCSDSGPVRS